MSLSLEIQLEKAIRLASKVHKGQVDRMGRPYILHVMRVMMRGRDPEEQVLGALHDVLERSDLTRSYLQEKGFGEVILIALEHISRNKGETYEDYIDRVLENDLASRVKLHDLADKMDLRGKAQLENGDVKRFNRHLAAYHKLKEKLVGSKAGKVTG